MSTWKSKKKPLQSSLSLFTVRRQVEVSSWFCALRCSATSQPKQSLTTKHQIHCWLCLCVPFAGLKQQSKKSLHSTFFFIKDLLLSSIKWMVSMCFVNKTCPVPRLCCAFKRTKSFFYLKKESASTLSSFIVFPKGLYRIQFWSSITIFWCSRSETCLSGFFLLIWILFISDSSIEVKARFLRLEGTKKLRKFFFFFLLWTKQKIQSKLVNKKTCFFFFASLKTNFYGLHIGIFNFSC